ncbi:MAG: hypothetical protein WB995_09510 [Candidatus Acidiferrales bacterium]
MLIDTYLPKYDERSYHEARVAADRATAFAALRALDLEGSSIVRMLFAIRTFPARFRVQERAVKPPRVARSFVDSMVDIGWVILEEAPGEELVAGTVTQPWEATVRFRGLSPREFVAFEEPGFTKIVWNIAAREADGAAIISTETRVLATSAGARRRFRRYWLVVRPGVKLIRRIALAKVRRELRRPQKRHGA